jgi:hypothetical protein
VWRNIEKKYRFSEGIKAKKRSYQFDNFFFIANKKTFRLVFLYESLLM